MSGRIQYKAKLFARIEGQILHGANLIPYTVSGGFF